MCRCLVVRCTDCDESLEKTENASKLVVLHKRSSGLVQYTVCKQFRVATRRFRTRFAVPAAILSRFSRAGRFFGKCFCRSQREFCVEHAFFVSWCVPTDALQFVKRRETFMFLYANKQRFGKDLSKSMIPRYNRNEQDEMMIRRQKRGVRRWKKL